jgi:hypothetical protein
MRALIGILAICFSKGAAESATGTSSGEGRIFHSELCDGVWLFCFQTADPKLLSDLD